MFDYTIFISIVALLCLVWWMSSMAIRHRQNTEWFYSALTTIGDCILTADACGNTVRLNEAAEKLTGWTSVEAMGKPARDLLRMVQYDTREPCESPVEKVLATGKIAEWMHNIVLIARNGSESTIDSSAAPVFGSNGRIKNVIVIFRDITERYAAEQKLLESEERLKAVTNAARIGMVMLDRERRYVYANNFYLQMLGISNVSLTGKRVSDVLPVVYEQIRPNLDRAFAGERLSYEVKGLNNKEKSLNRYYTVTYEPQFRQLLVMHVVIIVVDITDIKRAAELP